MTVMELRLLGFNQQKAMVSGRFLSALSSSSLSTLPLVRRMEPAFQLRGQKLKYLIQITIEFKKFLHLKNTTPLISLSAISGLHFDLPDLHAHNIICTCSDFYPLAPGVDERSKKIN